MLLLDGAVALLHHVQNMAEAWPMSGLHCFSAFEQEIMELYDMVGAPVDARRVMYNSVCRW
jgi:hypothetical protein